MANEKKLTNRQAIFVREIAAGKTQRQACLIAYPKSKRWNIKTVDVRANALIKNSAVVTALQEINNNENAKIQWNREIATKTLLELITRIKLEQQRIEFNYKETLEIKLKRINDIKKKLCNTKKKKSKSIMQKYLMKARKDYYDFSKKSLVTSTYSSTIIKCVQILNKMYGYTNLANEENNIEKFTTVKEFRELLSNAKNHNI